AGEADVAVGDVEIDRLQRDVREDLREAPLRDPAEELELHCPVEGDEVPLDLHRVRDAGRIDVRAAPLVTHHVHAPGEVGQRDGGVDRQTGDVPQGAVLAGVGAARIGAVSPRAGGDRRPGVLRARGYEGEQG